MKFSLARGALAVAMTLTLASCGGGKATFPINVTVGNVLYPGLVLSTNGMDVAVNPPATAGDVVNLTFPNEIEYGETYNVIPKGQGTTSTLGAMPAHQTCSSVTFPADGTAGQLATIQIYYTCSINAYALGGKITGLTAAGLVLTNGSTGGTYTATPVTDATTNAPTGAEITFAMATVPFNSTYGITVLSQPTNQTCRVTNGAGTMGLAEEAAGGVSNVLVTCTNNPT